jgi:diguanylate cyclase (GGDEF)-like protein/PAS domain S-box-containing protein
MMFYFSEKLQSLSSSLKKIGKSRPGRYLIALCFFSAALWARFALGDVLPSKGFPFLTFFPAVILSAYFVGLWPGVMVSLLSIFSAWYFFIEPSGSIAQTSFPDRIALGFFTIVLLVDCVIVHVMNNALSRLRTASDQLRASEVRVRGLLDNLFVYVGVLDLDGVLLEVNRAPLLLSGLERKQVINTALWDTPWWSDEDERNKLREAVRRAAHGESVRYDARLSHFGRQPMTIDLQVAPLRENSEGSISALVMSGVDVSARVKAMTDLDHSRRQALAMAQRAEADRRVMDTIFNAVPAAIILSDATGRLLKMNSATRHIWGQAPYSDSVSGYVEWKGWWADGSEKHGKPIAPDEWGLARALRGEHCSEIVEIEPFGQPGKRRLTLLSAAPILDELGSVEGGVVAQVDITERMAAEQALRENEVRLALALKASGTAVWEMDVGEGKIIPADEQLPGMLGYQGHELVTLDDWMQIVHEDDRQRLLNNVDQVIRGLQEGYSEEIRLRAEDGSWRWMLAQAIASRRDAEGKALRLVGANLDITERKASEQRIRDAALHDPLTGLPNRALVFEYGSHLLAGAQRRHACGALLFIDLDRFKPINDIYGHHIGDKVLQEVARRLHECTREEDLVGRLGGDEFVIMLQPLEKIFPRTGIVAQHVVDRISQPFHIDTLELSLTPSIGISYYPQHADTVSSLIHTADLAMYQAKQSGRANFQVYSPDLDTDAEAAYAVEVRLRKALKTRSFVLHYQPVMDIASGQLVGAEALVRLADDDAHAVGPQRFIPIAESSGLIAELGEWVLSEACRQHCAWKKEGLHITLAVNVSPLQFRQAGFASRLGNILRGTKVDPECMQLEVTESMIMENVDEAVQILSSIKELGVKVALDDFGTGYSSLSRLSRLPLDKLKVDQSFVRGIENDAGSRAVTDAVIALGHSLRLEVVAEGIESEGSLRYLQEQGCQQAQGYLFSRPLQAEEFARWCWERQAA